MIILNAPCVESEGRGILLQGPSGAGKSDLCLSLIDRGWRLVADDQVILNSSGSKLIGCPPISLRGLIEVRGVGILHIAHAISAPIYLVVDLVKFDSAERIPENVIWYFGSHKIPKIQICPFETSAIEKISIALKEFYNNICNKLHL